MVRNAEQTAQAAEESNLYPPGRCLQWSRLRALINALWPTAAIAWEKAERKNFNRKVPRGGFAFWTGGREGFGHIAISLGGTPVDDPWIRSTDAGGTGINATRRLSWFDANWPSLHYVGWADNVNGVTVPGVEGDWFDMATEADLRRIVREELDRPDYIETVSQAAQRAVWARDMRVENAEGETVTKSTADLLKGTWERVAKLLKRP